VYERRIHRPNRANAPSHSTWRRRHYYAVFRHFCRPVSPLSYMQCGSGTHYFSIQTKHIENHWAMHITISSTTDRNVLVMSTVVTTPAKVMAVEYMSLRSGAVYVIKPYRPRSSTVSVTQELSNIPTKTYISHSSVNFRTVLSESQRRQPISCRARNRF